MEGKTWYDVLAKIINSDEFKLKIKENGFYKCPNEYQTFGKYLKKEWNVTLTKNASNFLSIDFWHKQPKIFNNEYYIIRTGKGSFAIFDKNVFPPSYLKFSITNVIELDAIEPDGYDNPNQAFKENILENSALEQLRFNGGYEKILTNVLGRDKKYYVGIRGSTTTKCKVYFYRRDTNERILIYEYRGQADVDYSLWTEDSVSF